jgi:hypothetical protein
MVCTATGGLANDLISVTSDLSKSSRALRAASRAGKASAKLSSASFFSTAIILLKMGFYEKYQNKSRFLT